MCMKVDTVLLVFSRHHDGTEKARIRIWVVYETGWSFWYDRECLVENGQIIKYLPGSVLVKVAPETEQNQSVSGRPPRYQVIDSFSEGESSLQNSITLELERIKRDPVIWQHLLAYNPKVQSVESERR